MASSAAKTRARERGPDARFRLILIKAFCAASRPGAVHQGPRELNLEEELKDDMIEKV
jgi:hypothetical protein